MSEILTKLFKILDDAGPLSLAIENVMADDLTGLDGYIRIPSYMEQTGRYIANMFDMLKKTRIAPKYVNGVYKGFDCLDYNIPSVKGSRGMYMISYYHPITGDRSYYFGTTIRDPRDRIGKFVRMVSTGVVGESDNGAAPKKWIAKHGNTFDYGNVVFIPIDMSQSKLRDLEGWVIRYYNMLYPGSVLNTVEKPTLTLEKKFDVDTPALDGI